MKTETGISAAKILIPDTENLTAWACIACDQFTSEKEYWDELAEKVKGKLTALDLVLPEIYLGEGQAARIERINRNMRDYIKKGVFRELPEGFVLTVRKTPYKERRIGLVAAVDLDKYEYAKKSDALVRSTEGTIEERIPPRLEIRKNAELEFPHIMILFDDERKEITERLYAERAKYEKLYDFELNMGGGHIEGYFIPASEEILSRFAALLDEKRLTAKYGKNDKFAFAVGDGNHSLATAKAHWNAVKATLGEEERKAHPAKYALAEFVNIYDEGIYFEPIFRLVTGVDRKRFIEGLSGIADATFGIFDGERTTQKRGGDIPYSIAAADDYIKKYISENGGAVDYIHGEENLFSLVKKDESAVGITFDKLDKADLFKYVSAKGAFPRKTFSMGEGVEKRYYLEGRRIKND